jgi:hypothetical protein
MATHSAVKAIEQTGELAEEDSVPRPIGVSPSAVRGLASKSWAARADTVALCSLALGLALYVIPWWSEGRLRYAFWLTLLATVLHIITSHLRGNSEAA